MFIIPRSDFTLCPSSSHFSAGIKFADCLGNAIARINSVHCFISRRTNKGEGEHFMDAFELLKKDHEKVAGIFEKLEPTTERGVKTREELFTQLKHELDVHARIEEEFL